MVDNWHDIRKQYLQNKKAMESTKWDSDPRYALCRQLIDTITNDKPQTPFAITETNTLQYTDASWLEHEKKYLFSDVPIVVGFSAMLPKPGQHFTFDHADKPLLIVRGQDHKLRCFLNVCRHRGVRLSNAKGVAKSLSFTCQYHHWTYDLDGKLIAVPAEEGFPGLDKSCRGLAELAIEEAHGFIWVNPGKGGSIDLKAFLGNIASDLDNFGVASSFYFDQSVREVNANWKLIVEAFQDGYHVTRLHRKTVGKFFMDNVAVQERERQHIRSMVARTEFEECLTSPPEDWNFREQTTFSHYIFPNTMVIMHPDYTSQLSVFPVSPDKTIVVHNCVVESEPLTVKAVNHFEKSFKLIDQGVFASEDFHICEETQKGLKSGANETLLVGGYEPGIRVFHQILEDTLGVVE